MAKLAGLSTYTSRAPHLMLSPPWDRLLPNQKTPNTFASMNPEWQETMK